MRAPPDPATVRRILVRSTNWIGDIVMISPSLRALRRRFTKARIEVVAVPQMAPCLEGNPDVDEVIVFDRRGRDAGALGLVRFARRLRERRYDLAILFQKAMGAALLARLSGIPARVGLDTDRRGWLLTHPVPFTPELSRRHHLLIFAEVARAAGCALDDLRPFYPVAEAEREWAERFLSENRAERFRRLLALHISASKPQRAWHRNRFIESARRIAERHDAGVLLLGGPADAEDLSEAESALGAIAINACGRSTIGQMAALIARCDAFLGNDSGPMHVAGALGVPVIALFGPGDPDRTAAWAPELHASGVDHDGGSGIAPARVLPISRRYPCAPCRQDFFRECYPAPSGKPLCLESITVEEVVAAGDAVLGAPLSPEAARG